MRRIEALVGIDAYHFLAREHVLLSQLTEQLKAPADQLPDRVAKIVERLRTAEKDIERARKERLSSSMQDVAGPARRVGNVDLIDFQTPTAVPPNQLRELVLQARARAGDAHAAVVVGASVGADTVALVTAVNTAGQAAGIAADEILRVALAAVAGRGGGKADVAQGGGPGTDGVPQALDAVEQMLADR